MFKNILLTICLLALPLQVWGSITHDVSAGANLSGSTVTISLTVANQTNRILVVGVSSEGNSTATNYGASGVTYNSAAMTKIDEVKYNDGGGGTYNYVSLWYLIAPDTGTHNIVASFTTAPAAASAIGISLYGVAQQVYEAKNTASGADDVALTCNITTLTNNAWIVDAYSDNYSGADANPGAGQTGRGRQSSLQDLEMSTKPAALLGATNTSWDYGGGGNYNGIVNAAFVPYIEPENPVLDRTKVKYLWHANGINGATSATTDDPAGRTVTFEASAQFSTVWKFAGSASLLLSNSTQDYAHVPNSTAWNLGSSSFEMGARIRFNTLPGNGQSYGMFGQYVDDNNWWSFCVYNDAGTYLYRIMVRSGGVTVLNDYITISISTATPYSFALSRSGNTAYAFFQGNLLGTSDWTGISFPSLNSPLYHGVGVYADVRFDGYIDEAYIYDGVLHTTDYEPLDVEYSLSSATTYSTRSIAGGIGKGVMDR